MAEKDMIAAVQAALDDKGIEDVIEQVGQFKPRGSSGAGVAGAMIGGEAGGAFGEVGEGAGLGLGMAGGTLANAQSRGLPRQILVGASKHTVYGFKMLDFGRQKKPHDLVFQVPRAGLDVNVHGRVQVRVLELVEADTGAKVELEGNRLPITHSHDLIKYLVGDAAADAADAEAGEAGEPPEERA